ncbi:hypothetical protein TEA_024914 [Camellia sinensis var. sinensis]|uniref:Matrin-type domain-containing protein n=1 Tax=Camellia sinensis var. sinensis TaxID=542762 RepID=A0A4S4CZQ1_CAMSN|nr:hypothetical protein TEA_024914 [Camellia sinensis var. sinensis]
MDREWGSKPGSGGAASAQNEAIDRRERLRRLALETIDIAKDPYFMRNHLGSYECKLCLTLHNNEGNYLAHTQGKRHQTNLAKRAAREAKEAPALPQPHKRKVTLKKSVKIGRPGYRVTKQFDPETKQRSLLFQIEYPEIEDNTKPRHRFMSSFEQRVQSFDKRYQYLLFAAEPYEIISFKVPSTEIDKSTPKFFSHWDPDSKMFTEEGKMRRNKPRKYRISQLDLNGKERKPEMLKQSSTRRSRSAIKFEVRRRSRLPYMYLCRSLVLLCPVAISISCSSLSSCDLDLMFFSLSISPVLSSLDLFLSLPLPLSLSLESRGGGDSLGGRREGRVADGRVGASTREEGLGSVSDERWGGEGLRFKKRGAGGGGNGGGGGGNGGGE